MALCALTSRLTIIQLGEQVGKKIVGEVANVAFEVAVQQESGGDSRFVGSPPRAPAFRQRGRCHVGGGLGRKWK